MAHRIPNPRALLVATVLAAACALAVAPAANAHKLSGSKADKVATAYALSVAEDFAAEGLPVSGFEAFNCKRLSKHAVRCIWGVGLEDGSVCGGPATVKFRSKRSRKLRVVVAEPRCFDPDGNEIQKRAAKIQR